MMKKSPLTVTMDQYGDREYYGMWQKRTIQPKRARVSCIGRVTSDLSVFKEMGDSVTMTFDLKK